MSRARPFRICRYSGVEDSGLSPSSATRASDVGVTASCSIRNSVVGK